MPDPAEPTLKAIAGGSTDKPSTSPIKDPADPSQLLSRQRFAAVDPAGIEKKVGDVLIKPYADHAKKIVDEGGSLHRVLASLSLFALSTGKSKAQAKEIVAAYVIDQWKKGFADAAA
jgi:hypothetical protein